MKEADVSPVEHRVEMVRLAIAGKPYFKLSLIEVERSGPTYTVDTIAQLREMLGPEDEIYFIIGQDSLTQLPGWREPTRLIQMCYLVAAPRPGMPPPGLASLEKAIPGISKRVVLLDKPEIDVSATDIRERVARGLSIHGLVPEAVEEYIKKHRLYEG